MRLTVATMYGALSSRVPSRSNRASLGKRAMGAARTLTSGFGLARACEVVDIRAPDHACAVAPGFVHQATDVLELQPGLTQPFRQLRGLDEVAVLVSAP